MTDNETRVFRPHQTNTHLSVDYMCGWMAAIEAMEALVVPADTAALIAEARRTLVRPDGADLIYAEELLMRDLTDALESQSRELERVRMALREKEQA